MKTVFDNRQLAHVWAQQTQSIGHSNSMSFEGPTLYSYRTPIARIYADTCPDRFNVQGRVVLVTSDRYSTTTSCKHMPVMYRALRGGETYFCVPHVLTDTPQGYGGTRDSAGRALIGTHAQNLEYLRVEFDKESRRQERARDMNSERMRHLAQQCDDYALVFGMVSLDQREVCRVRINEVIALREARDKKNNTPANIAKRAADKIKREARKEAKEEAERVERNRTDAERIALWLSGDSDVFPNLWQRYGTSYSAMLRVKHGRVETSQGANVPLDDALRAIRFIKIIKARGTAWNENGETLPVGQFRVNSIDTDGNIKAGCHRILFEEIDRIAPMVERALELVSA